MFVLNVQPLLQIVKDILDNLSYGAVEALHKLSAKTVDTLSANPSPTTFSCAFASNIQFVPQKPWEPDTSSLADLTEAVATGGESAAAKEFNMRYDDCTAVPSSVPESRGAKKVLVRIVFFLMKIL